ncbi:hypothetical protein [Cellulophaga sp. Hel_I_12]|uniref:hypothetical protein n=1 Tax=Cellulophaga sp. Hel_I_12 TaxID=1249972 RepID=UPI0009DF735F|nr:hypothetical protein [Cellulophaga sp. Hel_I_12]
MNTNKYVLFSSDHQYVVEYLFNQLVLSNSISEALIFENYELAIRFQKTIVEECKCQCSINTYIEFNSSNT